MSALVDALVQLEGVEEERLSCPPTVMVGVRFSNNDSAVLPPPKSTTPPLPLLRLLAEEELAIIPPPSALVAVVFDKPGGSPLTQRGHDGKIIFHSPVMR